jgi:hypothetical protein
MNPKRYLNRIRGWFPKEPNVSRDNLKMAETKVSKPKPWWWAPLWIITVILAIVSGVVSYFLFDTTILRAVGGLALTLLCIGVAYYIRVRPSMRINRAVYILIGITPIGITMWFICSFIFNRIIITSASGTSHLFLILGAVCLGVGALIGDWIGKRRGYTLAMMP